MAQVNLEKALEAGREAVRHHAWREAFELLTAADQAGDLTAADLEGLAEAAWWNGRVDFCMSARERAFALRLEAEAARIAAAAQGGEVLASWHSAQACKFTLSEPREVNLKGIAQPVQVVSVSWR